MLTLSILRDYIRDKKRVSLSELAQAFAESPDMIQSMVYHLIYKSVVIEKKLTPHCGTKCQQCPMMSTIFYCWHE